MRKQNGFTLIEIAIVLVIIGLLLGGVLKGQELIQSARVRNLISQQDGVKAAYFGFLDRFRALPGDYSKASTTIAGTTVDGDNNGQISGPGTGAGTAKDEFIAAWEHLSHAGFINGSYLYGPGSPETNASVPTNPYARYLRIIYDKNYGDPSSGATPNRHNLKTGNQIPSDLMAEIDRKVDDGNPIGGTFQYSDYDGGGGNGSKPITGNCIDVAKQSWVTLTVEPNCGGASLF
jgi:prepilin-type N-terminal cleavage/methylation domain-containing protein